MALKPGDEAPDFELRSHRGGTVKLSDFRGKRKVVVAFHPLAFTPVCATQMSAYQSNLARFEALDAVVLGVSVDAQPAKAAWAESLGSISFDLLSDFHPQGDVARQYGVFRDNDGISERAIFVVGKDGRIAWARTYGIPEQPNDTELYEALRRDTVGG
jgi:peroxiredoxin